MTEKERDILDSYQLELFIFYYIYANNLKEILRKTMNILEDCIILTDAFIESLKLLVEENIECEILGPDEKDNVFELLNFIKENKQYSNEQEKIECYDVCNSMISKLNSSKEEGVDNFKNHLMLSRLSNRDELMKKNNEYYVDLGEAFGYDIIAFNSLLNCDTDMFSNMAMQFAFNEYFLMSVEKFRNDIPFIFKDEDVYLNTLTVFALNKGVGLSKEYKDAYKKNKMFNTLTKNGKKVLVKTKKMLDKE